MTFKKLATAASLLAVAGFSQAALSDEAPKTLESWIDGASETIDDVLYYPRTAQRTGKAGSAMFRVTIDGEGNVLRYNRLESAGYASLDAAARNVVKRADFPAIPANFGDDEMTFRLVLNYQQRRGPAFKYRNRQGRSDVEQLAKGKNRSQVAQIYIERPKSAE